MKKTLLHSVIDGLICACLFYLLGEYTFSDFLSSMGISILLGLFCAVILTVVYTMFLAAEHTKKHLLLFSGLSLLWFLLLIIFIFVINLATPIHILPVRVLDNADGLVLLMTYGALLISLVILRLITLIVFLLKTIHR